MPTQLLVKSSFAAAHFLPRYAGKPSQLHGHTWQVHILLEKDSIPLIPGILIDRKEIERMLEEVLPDHSLLNNQMLGHPRWHRRFENPTPENVAAALHAMLDEKLSEFDDSIRLVSLTLWETPDVGATYCLR